jgi:hypothetical protein
VTEDDIFEAIRALVVAGEYRDEVPGRPGVALEGGGAFQKTKDGVLRRIYWRGTPEYVEARRAGLLDKLPDLRVASPRTIVNAEKAIGLSLPPLLRRLYTEVGNGGFGPGYGLLRLENAHSDDTGETALSARDGWDSLPPELLPICNWGCAIYSLVDCSSPEGTMWGWDPNPVPPDESTSALFAQDFTFASWLARWIAGTIYQPTLVQDPATGHWRGASDDEARGYE